MTSLTALAVAMLTAGSAALLMPDTPDGRLQRILPGPRSSARTSTTRRWLPHGAAGLAALGILALVGGASGLIMAIGILVAGPRLLSRLESRGDRHRREAVERQAPLVADLLASTLAGGVPVVTALRAVADAVGEPSASPLRTVVAAFDLGAAPEIAWRTCPSELAVVAQAAVRSARTGAPLAVLLRRIADDLARDRRRAVEVAARSAGVRAVAPLAACFLPAFLLVGVVPVVVSLAGSLL